MQQEFLSTFLLWKPSLTFEHILYVTTTYKHFIIFTNIYILKRVFFGTCNNYFKVL